MYHELICGFWRDVIDQNAGTLCGWFAGNAVIRWHNSGEEFTVEEYVRANCEYPGHWRGEVERVLETTEGAVSVARVWSEDAAFRAVSFYQFQDGKISRLEEYWGDVGEAPQWRQAMGIGRPIGRERP